MHTPTDCVSLFLFPVANALPLLKDHLQMISHWLNCSWLLSCLLCLPYGSLGLLFCFLSAWKEQGCSSSKHLSGLCFHCLRLDGLLNFSIERKETVLENIFPVGGFSAGPVATAAMSHESSKLTTQAFIFIAGKWWWPVTLDGPSRRTQDSLFGHD